MSNQIIRSSACACAWAWLISALSWPDFLWVHWPWTGSPMLWQKSLIATNGHKPIFIITLALCYDNFFWWQPMVISLFLLLHRSRLLSPPNGMKQATIAWPMCFSVGQSKGCQGWGLRRGSGESIRGRGRTGGGGRSCRDSFWAAQDWQKSCGAPPFLPTPSF